MTLQLSPARAATAERADPTSSGAPDLAGRPAVGTALFDATLRLSSWTPEFFDLFQLPARLAEQGRPFEDFIRYVLARNGLGIGEIERQASQVVEQVRTAQPYREEWRSRDGAGVAVLTVPLYGGGAVVACAPSAMRHLLDPFLSHHASACSRPDVLNALDCMADGFALFDRNDRLVFCNGQFRAYHDRIADHLLPGCGYDDLLFAAFESGQFSEPGQTAEQLLELHRRAAAGEGENFEIRLADDRWLLCSETRTGDGNVVSIRSDITELKLRQAELTRLSDALRKQNLHFDTALNNMAQGLCLFDSQQRLIVCNQRYLEMYGFSPDVVRPGIELREIMKYSISLGNYALQDAAQALSERPIQAAMREQSVLEQWLSDGRVIRVLHQPMPGGGSVATYEDITQRKRAELRLEKHAQALERRNQELQEFAYVASHDLQEPLRKIEAFGGRLKAKFGDRLGDDGTLYIERMENAAIRMRALIEDLLSYSRVTTKGDPFEACDLNTIMAEVASDLEVRIAETGARLEIGDLPTIQASPVQMRQLFQNLLSNALKFIRPDVTPRIEVIFEEASVASKDIPGLFRRFCKLRVRDNGIGFEQSYAEQIFGIFQRLHGRTSFEGTGIGLATCKKIAERHAGSIEAVGEPDKGATFTILLPFDHDS